MKVQNPHAVTAGLDPLSIRGNEPPVGRSAEKQAKSAAGDALDLSLSSRVSELSSQIAAGLADPPAGLTPERSAQIQGRIHSAFYAQQETASATVDQLLSFYAR